MGLTRTASSTPFKVGNIEFTGFEAPEKLGDLGGETVYAKHKFAGGDISIQSFGCFPGLKKWSGVLYGSDAFSRALEIDQLRTNEEAISMTYGSWSFEGLLVTFEITAHYEYEVHYDAEFEVVDDKSKPTQSSPPQAVGLNLPQMQQITQQQATTPSSGATLSQPIQGSVSNINNALNSALNQNSGSLSSIPISQIQNIQNQIFNVLNLLSPLIGGVDPAVISAASDLSASLTVMSTILNQEVPPLLILPVINPNLMTIASQYYGDSNKWELIAAANNMIDYAPIGQFSLIIPTDIFADPTGPTLAYAAN